MFVLLFGFAELLLWLAGTTPLIQEEDPFRGFSGMVSVFEKQGHVYRTRRANTNTFNDQSFLIDKPENGYRIFGLGGSSAFGFPWGADAAFTQIVGEFLTAEHPERVVEAVNASGTSYAMHRLKLVARELFEYEPDLFLIYSGHNEFVEPAYFESLKARSSVRTGVEYALSHTRIYSAMRSAYGRKREPKGNEDLTVDVRRDDSRTYTSKEKEVIAEGYRGRLADLVAGAQEQGVKVILITVPANLSRWRPQASSRQDDLAGDDLRNWSTALLRGKELLRAGDPHGAAEPLSEAARLAPDHAETLFEFALALEGSGRFEEAISAFDRACDLDASPIRRTAAINDAVRSVASEFSVPLIDADLHFRESSEGGLVGFNLIEDYVHPNRQGHALIAWHVSREIEQRGWLAEGRAFGRAQFNRLIATRNAEAGPRNATWFFNTGVVLSDQARYPEAISKYREALEIKPDYPAALMNLGLLLVRTGQNEASLDPLEKLIQLDATQVGAYLNLGNALQNLGRYSEAIAHYRNAIRLQPGIAFAHNNLANALQSLDAFDEAEAHYREALRIRPDYANAHFNWGNSLKRQGRMRDAMAHYQESLRIEPNHPGARMRLSELKTR